MPLIFCSGKHILDKIIELLSFEVFIVYGAKKINCFFLRKNIMALCKSRALCVFAPIFCCKCFSKRLNLYYLMLALKRISKNYQLQSISIAEE